MSKVLPLAIAVAMAVTPAFAQQSGGGLVTVNISNVANDIARDLDVNVSNIPVTVQVPVSVAANVCNVSIDVLVRPGHRQREPELRRDQHQCRAEFDRPGSAQRPISLAGILRPSPVRGRGPFFRLDTRPFDRPRLG